MKHYLFIENLLSRLAVAIDAPAVLGCVYEDDDIIQFLAHSVRSNDHPAEAVLETYLVTCNLAFPKTASVRSYDCDTGYGPEFGI